MNTSQEQKDFQKKGYKINPSRDIKYPEKQKENENENKEEVTPDLGGDQTKISGPVKH